MSARRLPRQLGVVLVCDEDGCTARHQTANIRIRVNRRAASSLGWSRRKRLGRVRDLCGEHTAADAARTTAAREERRRVRDENRKKRRAAATTEGAPT